jgi:TonB family protein
VGPTSLADSISQDSTVYDTTQVSEQPIRRGGPKATFPRALHYSPGFEGRVRVGVIVNATGAVDQSSIAIVQSVDPALDSEARRLVAASSFWPACRSGRAVRVRVVIPIAFKVSG